MKYYAGIIKRNGKKTIQEYKDDLRQQGCQILESGYCTENYYFTVQTNKKPKITGQWKWLRNNNNIDDLDAIWIKPGFSSPLAQVWITLFNNYQYGISFKNYTGIIDYYKVFKTLLEAVNYLKQEGYIKDSKKTWI